MGTPMAEKSKIKAYYLLLASLTPFFVGLVLIFMDFLFVIKLNYSFGDFLSQFVVGGIIILLSMAMMVAAFYLWKSAEKNQRLFTG